MKKIIYILIGVMCIVSVNLLLEFVSPKDEALIVGQITAPENNSYKIGVLNYEYEIKDDSAHKGDIEYRLGGEYFRIKPLAIGWDDSIQTRVGINTMSLREPDNTFRDIFGGGVDMKITPTDRVLSKIIKIDSIQSVPTATRNSHTLDVVFNVETNMVVDGWDKKSPFVFDRQIRIGDFSYIKKPTAWDSSKNQTCVDGVCVEEPNVVNIEAELRESSGQYYLTKKIPYSWLKSATFPIYTDVDITYGSMSVASSTNVTTQILSGDKFSSTSFALCMTTFATLGVGIPNCYGASVSGSTITFGSPSANVVGDAFVQGIGGVVACVFDSDTLAVIYADDVLLDDGYIVAADISGTTFGSWGTAVEFETGDMELPSCANIDTNKIAISYNDETNSDTGSGVVCTASGTTITCGTVNDYATTDYQPTQISTTKLDTDKFVTCFDPQTDAITIQCAVATVSTRTITWGSVFDTTYETSGGVGNSILSTAGVGTDQFILAYASSTGRYGTVCTVSTTTPTCGSETQIVSNTSPSSFVKVVQTGTASSDVAFVGAQATTNDGESILLSSINWSSKTFSVGSPELFESGSIDINVGGFVVFPLDANTLIICYEESSADPDNIGCLIGEVAAIGTAAPQFQNVFWFD